MNIIAVKIKENAYEPSTTGKPGRFYSGIFGEKGSQGKERVVVAKLDKNVSYEKIRIKGPTHYYVLYGDLIIEDKVYNEGTYVRIESGEEFTPSTKNGCEVLCIYTQGWEKLSE